MKTFAQQPTPVPAQVELPPDFPEMPMEIIDRFGASAEDWKNRLNEWYSRFTQAIQQAQDQTAKQANSQVIFTVDRFLIYANGVPTPMFALDATGVRLGNVLVVNTPGRKIYIGAGEWANANTPFYVDTLGNFSLGDSFVWDAETDTLTITGIINATSGTIGGFEIGPDYIRDTINSFGLASTVTGGDDVRLWAGATFANRATAPFRVTEGGLLNATGATINGTITATSGTIGGFDVGPDYIRDSANTFGLSSVVSGINDVRFWAGDTFANRQTAPLRITENGSAKFSTMDITGAVYINPTLVAVTPAVYISGSTSGATIGTSALLIDTRVRTIPTSTPMLSGICLQAVLDKVGVSGVSGSSLYIDVKTQAANAPDTTYGIYLTDSSTAITRWGLYIATTARNFMAGDLTVASVGATTPGTGAFTTLNATGFSYSSSGNNLLLSGADGVIYRSGGAGTNSGLHRFRYFDTDVAVISSTGLAVTGVISTTNPIGGAGPNWKLGAYTAGAAIQAGKVRIEIAGVAYDLLTA